MFRIEVSQHGQKTGSGEEGKKSGREQEYKEKGTHAEPVIMDLFILQNSPQNSPGSF